MSFHVRRVAPRHWIISVGGGISECCSRQSDPGLGSVVDRVESLEEELAEDVVQSRSTLVAIVNNNQINAIWSSAASGMQFFNVESQLVLLLPSRNRLEIKITNVAG